MTALRAFAWVLGVVAALAVVGTSAAALVVRDPAPLVLRSAGARVDVPADGWKLMTKDGVGYADRSGRPAVSVPTPAVYAAGWCAEDRTMTHAFVGFVDRGGRTPAAIARDWGRAITLDRVTGKRVGPVTVDHALSGGVDRADADLRVPAGPCNPPREHLTVVAAGDQALVLVRDLDVDGALSERAAEDILDSLR